MRTNDFENGATFLTAYVDDEGSVRDGREGRVREREVAGFAKVVLPARMLKERKRKRRVTEKVLQDVVKPTLDGASARVWGRDTAGMDEEALAAFRVAQAEISKRHPYADDFYILYVHSPPFMRSFRFDMYVFVATYLGQ
jgi:hypothetical protein